MKITEKKQALIDVIIGYTCDNCNSKMTIEEFNKNGMSYMRGFDDVHFCSEKCCLDSIFKEYKKLIDDTCEIPDELFNEIIDDFIPHNIIDKFKITIQTIRNNRKNKQ